MQLQRHHYTDVRFYRHHGAVPLSTVLGTDL